MRIAFYNATFPNAETRWATTQNLSFGYLSAWLRRQFPDIETVYCPTQADLEASGADVACITSATHAYKVACNAAAAAHDGGIRVTVIGGSHITAMPDQFTRDFDYAVLSEGEDTLAELVGQLQKSMPPPSPQKIRGLMFWKDDQAVINERRELIDPIDELPFPDRELFGGVEALRDQTVSLISSRGCPHDCSHCSTTQHWGRKLRLFSPEYLVNEIGQVIELYHPAIVRFEDDLFVSSTKRLTEIAGLIYERGYHQRVAFQVSARPDRIDSEVCDILQSMNTKAVYLGLQSMQDHVLQTLGKNNVTAEVNARAVREIHRHGMRVVASFLFGVPGESLQDAHATHAWVHEHIDHFEHVEGSVLRPIPGTHMWTLAEEKGLVDENLTGFVLNPQEDATPWQTILEHLPLLNEEMTREQLALLNELYRETTTTTEKQAAARALNEELTECRKRGLERVKIRTLLREIVRRIERQFLTRG